MKLSIPLPLPPKCLMSRRAPVSRKGQMYVASERKKYRKECWYMTKVICGGFVRKLKSNPDYPKVRINVETTYTLRDKRSKQDGDNLLRWAKSAYDGIADAIEINDRYFTFQPVDVVYNSHKQGVSIDIKFSI